MIQRFEFVRRAAGVAPEAFHEQWAARHAAFVESHPEAAAGTIRWELHHRLDADYGRERHSAEVAGPQWDGVVHLVVADLDALAAFDAALAGSPLAPEGGDDLFDAARIAVVAEEPTVIVDKPGGRERGGLRLLCILRRKPGYELEPFHEHWREHHGGLFRNVASLNEPLLAYHQHHGLNLPGAAYDGLTEQWFASLEEWVESLGVPEYPELVEPDVASFLDESSLAYILAGSPTVLAG